MKWSDVGEFLKNNKKSSLALVGSLLTGNVAGAVAAGASMVSTATGTNDPKEAMEVLQSDPATMTRLKELAYENESDIRRHLEMMTKLELEAEQSSHEQTQQTIREGDKQDGIRWVRPGHATISLFAALWYALFTEAPDVAIMGALLALPFTYAGLRQIDKTGVVLAKASVERVKAGKRS